MDRNMMLKSELVVATSGVPSNSYLLSSGQIWSGIKTINISATATTISNESVIKMAPGLSNFSHIMDRQADAMMAAIFVLMYYQGRTHVFWKGTAVRGVEMVYFGSDVVSRETDIKIVTSDTAAIANIDTLRNPWIWVKSASSAMFVSSIPSA